MIERILGEPDQIIGDNYLHRWHLIPRNRWFNIYLHKFIGSDDDRALHDHPWHSLSFLLAGRCHEYVDKIYTKQGYYGVHHYTDQVTPRRFWPKYRSATYMHRIVVEQGPVWTLFITGPRVRRWGFLCPKGWVYWRDFCDDSGLRRGAGCGD